MSAKADWFRVWAAQTNDSLRHAQAGRRQNSAYSPPEITSLWIDRINKINRIMEAEGVIRSLQILPFRKDRIRIHRGVPNSFKILLILLILSKLQCFFQSCQAAAVFLRCANGNTDKFRQAVACHRPRNDAALLQFREDSGAIADFHEDEIGDRSHELQFQLAKGALEEMQPGMV